MNSKQIDETRTALKEALVRGIELYHKLYEKIGLSYIKEDLRLLSLDELDARYGESKALYVENCRTPPPSREKRHMVCPCAPRKRSAQCVDEEKECHTPPQKKTHLECPDAPKKRFSEITTENAPKITIKIPPSPNASKEKFSENSSKITIVLKMGEKKWDWEEKKWL